MALTNAERQRRHYQKRKAMLAEAPDLARAYLRTPLSEYVAADADRRETVDWIRQEIGLPLDYLLSGSDKVHELERTETLVRGLITSLETLAGLLSEYKIDQIDRELADLETSDFSTDETKSRLITDIIVLSDIRKQLQRSIRISLAEYEVKG